MLKFTPSFTFDKGQCGQAIELYTKAFGVEVTVKMLYSDADPKDFQCKDEEKDLIFHCQIKIGEQVLILGDDSGKMLDENAQDKSSRLALLIQFNTDDELKAAYEVLSDGANILSPLSSTTYFSSCATLIDKFGMRWELMCGYTGEGM